MTVAEQIKNARKDLNLSQKGLAELVGVGIMTINAYETGKREPRKENLDKIEKALGIRLGSAETSSRKKSAATPKNATVKKAKKQKPANIRSDKATIVIQSQTCDSITEQEIIDRIKSVSKDALRIYVKPAENKAYWVSENSAGCVELWT